MKWDLQRDLFNKHHVTEPYGFFVPKVTEALYKFERGDITQGPTGCNTE